MELRDQDFRVKDKAIWLGDHLNIIQGIVASTNRSDSGEGLIVTVAFNGKEDNFSCKGQWSEDKPQTLFHRDAITFDKHGRLTAINYDYVKERTPRIVTKEPHEFEPFERVLVRGDTKSPWWPNLFARYEKEGVYGCYYMCISQDWFAQCIPFKGNEHLVGKEAE